ncbi:putative transcription factor GRAS family [Helianthus annuus]|nr:putative transcription factor GRAS family [Helianthus annuus]
MREIRKINPCITIVNEVEANHASLLFVNRFIDALFFYGALFDSMSVCLADDDLNRKVAESVYYAYSIHNIVAAEGDDRMIRHTGIDVWRAFFCRFGMVEIELSGESLNEAKLLIQNFNCGNCCTIRPSGRCFLVAWDGVPIFSVSAWKFI